MNFENLQNYDSWKQFIWPDFKVFFELPQFIHQNSNDITPEYSHYFTGDDKENFTISLYAWRDSSNPKLSEKDAADNGWKNYDIIAEKEILSRKNYTNPNKIMFDTIYACGKNNNRKVYLLIVGFKIFRDSVYDYAYMTFAWWDLDLSNDAFKKISWRTIDKIRFYRPLPQQSE